MIIGHLAVSALLHRYLKADLVPAVAGGIAPDVVDKTLCQVLHWLPNGRMYAHTLLGMGLSTLLVGLIWGRYRAYSWALGYLGHLAGDLGGTVPWAYPLLKYDFSKPSPGLWQIVRRALSDRVEVGIESALLIWAVWALCWSPLRQRTRSPLISPALRDGRSIGQVDGL
jgi:hypothetical protein